MNETDRDALADELLAVRCQLGEPTGFDDLVERWNPALWHYVQRMVGDEDEASDALQDIWIRILRGLPALREPARIRPWLFGIARRALMDRLRRSYGRAELPNAVLDESPAPEPDHALLDDLDEMREELSAMPILEREVIVLFYLDELPLAQVADVLGIPEGTVKSRLFRARKTLRERLEMKGTDR